MREKKDTMVKLFLWFLFIVIALFLAFWLYSIYDQYMKTGDIGVGVGETFGCSGYIYDITDISYEEKVLKFTLRNKIGDTIYNLTVQSDTEERTVQFARIGTNQNADVVLENFTIKNNIAVFPPGCAKMNSKIINVVS